MVWLSSLAVLGGDQLLSRSHNLRVEFIAAHMLADMCSKVSAVSPNPTTNTCENKRPEFETLHLVNAL